MKPSKPSRKQLVYLSAIASSIAFVIYCAVSSPEQISWTGFKKDTEVSKTEKIIENGKEITVVTKDVSGKTLWDFLQLFGTLALPVLLLFLANRFQEQEKEAQEVKQHLDKKTSEDNHRLEKEIAEDNQRGQALETYLDRVSNILLDQQLFSLDRNKPDEALMYDTALDVIRARTLEILRRFSRDRNNIDHERKRRVLLFLHDVDLICDSKETLRAKSRKKVGTDKPLLNLSNADFSDTNLSSADFNGANLRGSDFSNADLSNVNLSDADLSGTNLSNANLGNADLRCTKLSYTDLRGTNLSGANLSYADLRDADLRGSDFTDATYNERTQLPADCDPKPAGW